MREEKKLNLEVIPGNESYQIIGLNYQAYRFFQIGGAQSGKNINIFCSFFNIPSKQQTFWLYI